MSISLTTLPGPVSGPFAPVFELLKQAGGQIFEMDEYNTVRYKLPDGWMIFEEGFGNQYDKYKRQDGDYYNRCTWYFVDAERKVRLWFDRNSITTCFMVTDSYPEALLLETLPFTHPVPKYYSVNKDGYLSIDPLSKESQLLTALEKLQTTYTAYLENGFSTYVVYWTNDELKHDVDDQLSIVRNLQKDCDYFGKEFDNYRAILEHDLPMTKEKIFVYCSELISKLKSHPSDKNICKILYILEKYSGALYRIKSEMKEAGQSTDQLDMVYLEWPSQLGNISETPITSFVQKYFWDE